MEDFCDPMNVQVPDSVLYYVPRLVAIQYSVLPVRMESDVLVVAVRDPFDSELRDELAFICNREVRLVAAPWSSLCMAIFRYYGKSPNAR